MMSNWKNFIFLYVVILIVIIVLVILYFSGISKDILLGIGAVLLAPLISIFVGGYLHSKIEREREEYETLKALVSFRHIPASPESLGALNRVILVFDKNKEIKKLVKELWNGYVNGENSAVSKRRQIELLYAICRHMKRDVTEFEIDSFFTPASPPILTPSPLPSQNQNSTVSNNNNSTTTIESHINYSITAGSFLDF